MKKSCIILVLTALMAPSLVYAKRAHADKECARIPFIRLEEALSKASAQVALSGQQVSELFADSTNYRCDEGRAYWEIGWRRKAYESGHLMVKLFEEGTVETNVIKDS